MKKLIIAMLFMMVVVMLAGCGRGQRRRPSDENVITLGTLAIHDETVYDAKKIFEEKNPGCRVDIKEYSGKDGYERLMTELSTGNAPDIIDLSGLPVREFVKRGIFVSLDEYFENDDEISTSDFLEAPFEASKIDGKLYYTPSSFGINTILAKTSEVGNKTGWTVNEMADHIMGLSDDVMVFPADTKEEVLNSSIASSYDDFIDWDTGKVSFDSEEFKKILKMTDKCPIDGNERYPGYSIGKLFSEGKLCFIKEMGVGGIPGYIADIKIFGEPVTAIGYPNKDRQGSSFQFFEQYAITTKSDQKDLSWKFLKAVMSKEHQYNMTFPIMFCGVPARKDCFDMYVRSITAKESYEDELGNIIEPHRASYSMGEDDVNLEQGALSEDEVNEYIKAMNATKRVLDWDSPINTIILEESYKYFQKERSLEETVNVINDRVSRYVAERK